MSHVKSASRFSIYCPKHEVHLCRQIVNEKEVLVGMVEPPSNHYGWRLNNVQEVSDSASHIHNFDLVYITNRNSNGKLMLKDSKLVVEETSPLYPLKTEPKSFECLWRVTKLMDNKYKRAKEIFHDSGNSPSSDLQMLLFSQAILNPYLKEYQLKEQEDLSSVTLTDILTQSKLGE